jgi:hypothetical protein
VGTVGRKLGTNKADFTPGRPNIETGLFLHALVQSTEDIKRKDVHAN